MRNKKAAGKILAIYWFAILVIIAFGVWAMAYAYYSHPLDVREIEVQILSNKVADCISQKGKINPNFFDNEGNLSFDVANFEKECNFNPYVGGQEKGDRNQYYVEINFYDIDENEKLKIIYGTPSIKFTDCEALKGDILFERIAKCMRERFYAVDENNQQYLIEIFVGLRKQRENVKI